MAVYDCRLVRAKGAIYKETDCTSGCKGLQRVKQYCMCSSPLVPRASTLIILDRVKRVVKEGKPSLARRTTMDVHKQPSFITDT